MIKQIIDGLPADEKRKFMMHMISSLAEDFPNLEKEQQDELRPQIEDLVINLRQMIEHQTKDLKTAEDAFHKIEAYYASQETTATAD